MKPAMTRLVRKMHPPSSGRALLGIHTAIAAEWLESLPCYRAGSSDRFTMRYLALATDYDGTLAKDGQVHDDTIEALQRLKASGRKLFMVTGRHLPDLQRVFPKPELFDRIGAENGALLYDPASREEKTLSEAPNQEFLKALRAERVNFDVGRCIVASWTP